jgi:endonuclease YncB( thermonuclease family)
MRMTTSRCPGSRAVCFVLLALPLALLWACTPSGSTFEEGASRDASGSLGDRGPVVTVSRVVDGDTVEVAPAVEGLTEVRLIGVDTPETSHPTYGEQPYGQQAKEFTISRLQGEQVALKPPVAGSYVRAHRLQTPQIRRTPGLRFRVLLEDWAKSPAQPAPRCT